MVWTTPRTWVAGEKPTAATFNLHVRDNFAAIGDAWTSYTPTWTGSTTNPTIGNGTLSGAYSQAGKLVQFRIQLTFGSTTTAGSGAYTWALPVTPITFIQGVVAYGLSFDASAPARYPNVGTHDGSGGINLFGTAAGATVTATSPVTWATGDKITISGTYEAA